MNNQLTQLYGDARTQGSDLRTALIDSVTHDFRTPLTAIKAAVTTLLSDSRVRLSQRNELLSIINEEAERLNKLVGSAVEASRLGAHVQLDPGPQTIAAIVDAARKDCRKESSSRPLRIQLEPELPPVLADLQRAKKALLQLLENAAKYSPAGEPITVIAKVSGQFVEISVVDRGSGVEPSEQKLIFKRSYRGKDHRHIVQGSGMGLPIANAIIKAHGGTLTVASQHGLGSTFTFTLPLYKGCR